ncbi:glycosyltransferase family 4 protein [Endozoicomonas sp. SM1973]|uniref:Glycosyltransferase family 4 protein n=1 Tax=Spartinivicinus marinus TaxID=2994442 RepID=A0A853I4N7_9GAMM|nr:glycosyltransferase family 4 protein [Spartinivicinus marinus]MCX4028824.1 glycosyltransferase family 4 protein [Spartinivicinus marinus]NYZ67639.1 glycosyltransferase family 4 protein [Spartinivicinus marinus]
MKILILTFYYPPDLSAGSFRASALVKSLQNELPKDTKIDVLTTLPNRYQSYVSKAVEYEKFKTLFIRRIKLPSHNSGMIDQSKAFYSFAKEVIKYINSENYDLVCATSSRLMTAALGAWVARKHQAKLYLDIRDIFVDTIKDVLPFWFAMLVKPFFSQAESRTIKQADKVNLVSPGFKNYFETRYPFPKYTFFTNGIDEAFLSSYHTSKYVNKKKEELTVLYAGNIGEGQGLHEIVPQLANCLQGRVRFKIIGDGGRKAVLQSQLVEHSATNVELLPPMEREKLKEAYESADVLFLHLNDYDAFKKVLPSKVFEYAALGKPIWAGVAGYSANFIRTEISNAEVFPPCNRTEAVKAFDRLKLANQPRTNFVLKYSRPHIMQSMARDIISLLPEVKLQ